MRPAITSRVDMHNGVPTLFIDGKPATGLQFWHSQPMAAGPDFELMAAAGVNIVTTGFPGTFGEGPDMEEASRRMELILSANPTALVMPRIGLNPEQAWFDAHPDEQQVSYDLNNPEDEFRDLPCLASPGWQAAAAEQLCAFIDLFEGRWPDRMVAYHPCAGATGEFAHRWGPVISGYANAHRDAFRGWLAERYRGDINALRTAWNDASVDFDTASVPREGRVRFPHRWGDPPALYNPALAGRWIDAMSFHAEGTADGIVRIAGAAKRRLAKLGRDKVVGVFYGYHIFAPGVSWGIGNAGHTAGRKVFSCPDIDFIAAPVSYQERQPGGMYGGKMMAGSLRLHKTLYYIEDDTFTHLAKRTRWRYCCPDAETTGELLWRNLLGAMQDHGTLWWMDHDGDGWYRDDGLMTEVEAMRRFAEDQLDHDRSPKAEILVVGCPRSIRHMRYDEALADAIHPETYSELTTIGAPFETLDIDDLAAFFADPANAARIRMVVFLDAFALTEASRAAIRRHCQTGSRTVVWQYAVDLLTGNGVDLENMSRTMGISVGMHEDARAPRAETYVNGSRHVYGTDRKLRPVLFLDDAEADILGWQLEQGAPTLARRQFDGWTSIFSATPAVPGTLLRSFAESAGVHIYSRQSAQVFRFGDILGLHVRQGGTQRLDLPPGTRAVDIRTGAARTTDGDGVLGIPVPRGRTTVFRIG